MIEGIGGNPSLIFEVLRAGQNTNGSPLALYLSGFRRYRALMMRAGIDIRDKVVMEIGAGPHPGTALAFLLHGARKVIINDVGKVAQVLSLDDARIIQWLAKLVTNRDTVPLHAVTEPMAGCEDRMTFPRNRFEAIPHTGAEAIGLPDESVDMILSNSVLEHVMKPREVIANTFRLLKRGGWCINAIDLKDHASPLEPLGFLEKSRAVYESGGTENRVRALDFIQIFTGIGYDIRHVEFYDEPAVVDEFGNIDGMALFLADPDERSPHCHDHLESIEPWVTEAARQKLDPEFRSRSLQELSILGMHIAARKPV
jgi:SAM-dependent methyltransferase